MGARSPHKARSALGSARGRPVISRWIIGLPVLIVLAVLTGLGIASGWLPSLVVPRKIVVRGNAIITASDLLAAAGQANHANVYHWWTALDGLEHEQVRWLADAKPRLGGWGRTLVVQVEEQRPLLYVQAADRDYWLCDNWQLVPVAPEQDTHPVFEQIKKLPMVELESNAASLSNSQAEGILTAAACLRQALPGVMRRIRLDAQDELWCYNQDGFAVRLGAMERLPEKISALPKALRICAAERRQLQYLDASDPQIFYQRWQKPPEA